MRYNDATGVQEVTTTVEDVQEARKDYEAARSEWSKSDDLYGRPSRSDLAMEEAIFYLQSRDEIDHLGVCRSLPGIIYVDLTYVIAPKNKRWRKLGRPTWYHYKDLPDLLDRYLYKDEHKQAQYKQALSERG